ncbi:MAG TPA: prenyltransferase/squalene oxidase repeat-containing protein, partial [Candidatus Brocadiia bacterium]|nr:prenyltransferase/squalene oxidase repeat-containing protein [Candidatus Brocadiia bacterium]
AFVAMSLAAAGRAGHPVARSCATFLVRNARDDGSWPIEVSLCTWLTTMSVEALRHDAWRDDGVERWILSQQVMRQHDYTGAAPGGWGWNDLPGSLPDADDTSGALLALRLLGGGAAAAARAGAKWLLDLQNADGGWPTFCRGWGRLPFDRSAPDLAAHALRALHAWRHALPGRSLDRTLRRGLAYLRRSQRADGSWAPLWFGNQAAPGKQNPVYGTARVLAAFRDLDLCADAAALRGTQFLLAAQGAKGGWGGAPGVAPSIEETALALDALAGWPYNEEVALACERGAAFLAEALAQGGLDRPAPVGLYFEQLWYWEKLYPVVWSVAALGRFLAAEGALGAVPTPPRS